MLQRARARKQQRLGGGRAGCLVDERADHGTRLIIITWWTSVQVTARDFSFLLSSPLSSATARGPAPSLPTIVGSRLWKLPLASVAISWPESVDLVLDRSPPSLRSVVACGVSP